MFITSFTWATLVSYTLATPELPRPSVIVNVGGWGRRKKNLAVTCLVGGWYGPSMLSCLSKHADDGLCAASSLGLFLLGGGQRWVLTWVPDLCFHPQQWFLQGGVSAGKRQQCSTYLFVWSHSDGYRGTAVIGCNNDHWVIPARWC